MKKTKFLTAITLAAALLFSACNKVEPEEPDDNNDPDQTEESSEGTLTVAMSLTDGLTEPNFLTFYIFNSDGSAQREDYNDYSTSYSFTLSPETYTVVAVGNVDADALPTEDNATTLGLTEFVNSLLDLSSTYTSMLSGYTEATVVADETETVVLTLKNGVLGLPDVEVEVEVEVESTAITFTATSNSGWEGITSVGVMIGDTVKVYSVSDVNNTSATLSSDDPHYWSTDYDDVTVTAWWPYTEGETVPPVVNADQSTLEKFEANYSISAEDQTVSYDNPTLTFTNRTARVNIKVTDYIGEPKSVKLTNLSDDNGNPTEIVPYKYDEESYTYTYVALVAPQTVAANTTFISGEFNNGDTFTYEMQESTTWNAGEEYTYTVSLADVGSGYIYEESTTTYMVYSAKGLLAWNTAASSNLTLSCTLIADIDLTEVDWENTPWSRVGTNTNTYTGTFEGGGYTITGLTINQSETYYIGLIGCLGSGGKVQNLTLDNVDITGYRYVGGVVGYNNGGTVTNCHSTGSVTGTHYVGGVVGENNGGTVTACSSSSSVSSGPTYTYAGGVVGSNRGTMTACYSTGSVNGYDTVGGVVARIDNGTVTACYHASGSINGSSVYNTIGGVVGSLHDNTSTVTACYYSDYDGSGDHYGLTTKVDGETVTWERAVNYMNVAIYEWNDANSTNPDKQCEWKYELLTGNDYPTLTKISSE